MQGLYSKTRKATRNSAYKLKQLLYDYRNPLFFNFTRNEIEHLIYLHDIDTFITWIPKNACSSIRNNSIKHMKKCSFSYESIRFYKKSSKKVIFLRNPFDRILSFYLEKIVEIKLPSWTTFFFELAQKSKGCEYINFTNFLESLNLNNSFLRSDHTMPQNKFFLGGELKNYTSVFKLNHLAGYGKQFGINFKIDDKIESDDGLKGESHGSNQYERKFINNAELIPSYELLYMKKKGILPSKESFDTDNIRKLIKRLYPIDLDIYSSFKFNEP